MVCSSDMLFVIYGVGMCLNRSGLTCLVTRAPGEVALTLLREQAALDSEPSSQSPILDATLGRHPHLTTGDRAKAWCTPSWYFVASKM
jgi:hypothetical protein